MGTIIARTRCDGTTGYTAQILIRREGRVVHDETQTFDRKGAAASWLRRRQAQLDEPGALERPKVVDPSLKEVIDRYTRESARHLIFGTTLDMVVLYPGLSRRLH